MTKPAERLRAWGRETITGDDSLSWKCAALLDECERVLDGIVGDNPNALSYAPARATLAKLRGEA